MNYTLEKVVSITGNSANNMFRPILLLVLLSGVVSAQKSRAECAEITISYRAKENGTGIRTAGPSGTYTAALQDVASRRTSLKRQVKGRRIPDTVYSKAMALLEESIVERVIPFWYGTEWDFEGHTNTPGKGRVACGYFVSTVLRHCGFAVNRFRLAQQSPYYEAITLQLSDSVKILEMGPGDFIDRFKKEFTDGLYFAGLENHVGFLHLKKDTLIFIHSSYVSPLCVVAEDVRTSVAFNYSRRVIVAELSTNRKLVEYWLRDTTIPVEMPR